MEPISADRRRADRIPVDVPVLLVRSIDDPDIWDGSVRNMSEGGASVTVDRVVGVGTLMYAGFFLPGFGGLPLIAKVRVAWTRPHDGAHGLGLAFAADGPAQRDSVERIRDYLAMRRREIVGAAG